MKNYTDKEIQEIFKTTSGYFSADREHFRKIVASLDMDTAHSTPKILLPNSLPSPFVFFQSRFVQVAASSFVFMFALLGFYSSSNAPTKDATSGSVAQRISGTNQTDATAGSAVATNNTNSLDSQKSNTKNYSLLAKNKSQTETAAIVSAVSTELSAEQDASADLFALSDI